MDARTPSVVSAVKATDLLLGHDEWGMEWISRHRAAQARAEAAAAVT
jgi:5-methyltetrahydrofolate--homocysteine methyltransferase